LPNGEEATDDCEEENPEGAGLRELNPSRGGAAAEGVGIGEV
jgi:hypothetical protein